MREIKFRVWDKTDNRWLNYDDVFINQEGEIYLIEERNWAYQSYMHQENITEKVEISQYSGLKNKNGKEIYEGDIVNVNYYGGTPKYEKVHFYTVGGFIGFHPFTDDGHHWSAKLCDIVGDIYENPELLKSN